MRKLIAMLMLAASVTTASAEPSDKQIAAALMTGVAAWCIVVKGVPTDKEYLLDAGLVTLSLGDVTKEAQQMVVTYLNKIGKDAFCRENKPTLDAAIASARKSGALGELRAAMGAGK
jgi:hypothetical protein